MTIAIETFDLTRRFGGGRQRPESAGAGGSIFAFLGPNGRGQDHDPQARADEPGAPDTRPADVLSALTRGVWARATSSGSEYVSENQRLPEVDDTGSAVRRLPPVYQQGMTRCRQSSSRIGLTLEAPLRTLSRGTRMKAALLASLLYRPDLVVLDEPLTGLDRSSATRWFSGCSRWSGERPWTVLISSHDIDEVERLADWVGLIEDGRLLFAESVAALLEADRFRLVEVCRVRVSTPRRAPEAYRMARPKNSGPHAPVHRHAPRQPRRRLDDRPRVSGCAPGPQAFPVGRFAQATTVHRPAAGKVEEK